MSLAPGDRMGPYEIRRRIGAGGMGEVYSAVDTRLRREVAIKVVPETSMSAANRARLEREAQAVAALSHPNVISVFDVGTEGDAFFVVTELLDGRTIREILRDGPLPIGTAVDYARQAASALQSAHTKGIIHRDIKPENLFVTNDGRLKVLDFGLARVIEDSEAVTAVHKPQLTAPDTVLGTIGYMSPEQLRGETVDHRTDIFSLGCVLFEMLGGRPPFLRQSQTATVAAILNDVPEYAPLSFVPPHVLAVVQRCVAKDPKNRYQSADALVADLYVSSEVPTITLATSKRRSWRGPLAAAALIAIALVIAALVTMQREKKTPPQPPSQAHRRTMLAVLPFENLSGDASQEYFSDGLTEDTTTEFGRLAPDNLGVIARTSTMRYKNARTDVRNIGRELGVDYVVEGSVRRQGNRVRVAAQLVRASDGTQVWADTYDRTVDDVLAMQSELARNVASAVQIKVIPARPILSSNASTTEAAREAFLRGRYHLNLGNIADRRKALQYMEQAVAIDPDSASANAGLARVLVDGSTFEFTPRQVIPRARDLVTRALQLDPNLPEAHKVLGRIYLDFDWNWADAEREFKRALALNPNAADVHAAYATLLVTSGRLNEFVQEQKRARTLDPVSPSESRGELFNLFCARKYDAALEAARKDVDINPNNDIAYAIVAMVQLNKGNAASAVATANRVLSMQASPLSRTIAAYVFARSGREGDARKVVERIEAEAQKHFACFFNVAAVYAALGENDRAFAALERAYTDRTG